MGCIVGFLAKKHEHQEQTLFVIGIWSPWNYGEIYIYPVVAEKTHIHL